ncbi:hypothetical protein [Ruegeria sp. R14_0]|uniref:hypothetical protein n=1 Tax=Ruegeria sp. R14_0 TaxID=2821100 RepID=UPI001ADC1576|nr:hypothetical protein [Ruegeria sp. R14_0]MBO9445668.1 hypothetical protein [Ruegeria sp. R14_0]
MASAVPGSSNAAAPAALAAKGAALTVAVSPWAAPIAAAAEPAARSNVALRAARVVHQPG